MTALLRSRQYAIGVAGNVVIDLNTDLGVRGGYHGSFIISNIGANPVSIRVNGAANAAANEDDTYYIPTGRSRRIQPTPRIDAWSQLGTTIEVVGDSGGYVSEIL